MDNEITKATKSLLRVSEEALVRLISEQPVASGFRNALIRSVAKATGQDEDALGTAAALVIVLSNEEDVHDVFVRAVKDKTLTEEEGKRAEEEPGSGLHLTH